MYCFNVACKKPVEEDWRCCPYCTRKIKCGNCNRILGDTWVCCPYCPGSTEEPEGLMAANSDLTTGSDEHPDLPTSDQNSRTEETMANATQLTENNVFTPPDMTQYISKFEEVYRREGIQGVYKSIKDDIHKWKKEPLEILIVGESGAGKSSFINAMLGLESYETHGAKVDIVEATLKRRKYPHPKYPNFVLWDAPGVGTSQFPRETYLEAVQFTKCDFIIIISANRFTTNDAWLANEARKANKNFYFVRTKIDIDLMSETSIKGETSSQKIARVLKSCVDSLVINKFENPSVFLISNKFEHRNSFDLGSLIKKLLTEAPALKTESLALAISLKIKPAIEQKKTTLKARIGKVACEAAIQNFLIPVFKDNGFASLMTECITYKEQFGTDTKSLKALVEDSEIKLDELNKEFFLESSNILNTPKAFKTFCLKRREITDGPCTYKRTFVEQFLSIFYYKQFYCALDELLEMCYAEYETFNSKSSRVLEQK